MATATFENSVTMWISACIDCLKKRASLPYLDEHLPELDALLPLDCEDATEQDLHNYLSLCWRLLTDQGHDPRLRFAALYPIRFGGIASAYASAWTRTRAEKYRGSFSSLAGAIFPETISDPEAVRFELHNCYLAGHWEKAEELFRRAAVLSLFSADELCLIRGHYRFMSVFGRRIEFELLDNADSGFEFFWPITLFRAVSGRQRFERASRLAHPEFIESKSETHWILCAWCLNPREPETFQCPAEPLPFSTSPRGDVLDDAQASMRRFIDKTYRNFVPTVVPNLSQDERKRLTEAAKDINLGIESMGAAAHQYRPILARSLYSLQAHALAADIYGQLLSEQFNHEEDDTIYVESYIWEAYFNLALCHYRNGQLELALATLEALSRIPGHSNGCAWWMAKWAAENTQYDRAAQYLKQELDCRFSPEESWQLSIVLAVGAATDYDLTNFHGRLARENPNLYSVSIGLIEEFWPKYPQLNGDSQSHWLHGVLQLYVHPLPEITARDIETAVKDIAWVLENELKRCIFLPFRDLVYRDSGLRKQALSDKSNFSSDIYSFLTAASPKIGLGAMIDAVKQSKNSVVKTDIEFRRLLEKRFPELSKFVPEMDRIKTLRNQVTHGTPTEKVTTARSLAADCRRVLDAIL